MAINEIEAKEKFEKFLMEMDDQLESLEDIASSKNINLDLTISSVDKLEKLFNLMATNLDKNTKDSLIVTFARYLGEIVRNTYGGQWTLPLDDPKNINFNTPVITGHTQGGLEFAPISVMRAFALRRNPGTLKRAIDADININPVDLNGLIEEE